MRTFFHKNKTLLILAVLIVPSVFRLFCPGFFFMYDDMQVIRVQQMYACLVDFQIPCRWVPDLGFGYGYPLYQYYAPLPYYFMALFPFFGFSFIASVKIGFVASVIFSAYFFYLFLKRNVNENLALLGSVLYVYSPVRAADLYVRGGMGQLWGLAFLPLLFWGFEKLIKRERFSELIFAISSALFVLSHNITVFMSASLFAVWVIMRLYSVEKNIRSRVVKSFVKSSVLGLFLSAFYTVPLFFEINLVHINTLTQGYFNYLAHFVSVKQLLFSFHWGYGPSILGSGDDTSLSAGPLHFALVVISIFVLIIRRKKIKKSFEIFVLLIGYFTFLFLVHQKSTFIWQKISILEFLQFPWRYLVITSFIAPMIIVFSFSTFTRNLQKIMIAVICACTLVVYNGFFVPKNWFSMTDAEKLSGNNYERQITASIYDYLPMSASKAPDAKAPDNLIVQNGDVDILSSKRGTNWFEYDIVINTDSADVTIPTYDFPEWKVVTEKGDVHYTSENELGLLDITLPNGKHTLRAKLEKSASRKAGDLLTVVGIFMSGYVFVNTRKKF